jgi:predicted DNA binding protein
VTGWVRVLLVEFRFRHNCPVSRVSKRLPALRIIQWCNFRTDYFELESEDPALLETGRRALMSLRRFGVRFISAGPQGEGRVHLALRCGLQRPSILRLLDQHRALFVPPIRYHQGWEHYRAVATDRRVIAHLLRRLRQLGGVDLLSVRTIGPRTRLEFVLVPPDDLLSSLTTLQAAALLDAFEHGYYARPRKVRFTDIARARGIPRTTFEERVLRAESGVMRRLAPYLVQRVRSGSTR